MPAMPGHLTARYVPLTLTIIALSLSWRTLAAPPATQPSAHPATAPSASVKKVSLKDFDAMRAEEGTVVLDVRTPREFNAGHVPGAVNVDWRARDFADQVGKLDKSKRYVLHCLGGVRSKAASQKMAEMGFAQLFDYSGGWMEYSKASGEPVAK